MIALLQKHERVGAPRLRRPHHRGRPLLLSGAKPSISFDEKYFVVHSYVKAGNWQDLGFTSANDAGFKAMLEKGTSNIVLVNMVTGVRTRVTKMKAGQYALFPHWRSDGWFYFLVRDGNSDKEYVVASDAALTL